MGELTEKEVAALIEGARVKGELKFKSSAEYREALSLMSREELEALLVYQWEQRNPQAH